jgi:glycolate oxidase FAD binding subunit
MLRIEDLQSAVRAVPGPLAARGGGTKPGLAAPEGVSVLDLSGLSGILAYDSGEFTFTALAGTPLAVVEAALAEHGQYLPFDPPLAARGATLGGTLAAGLSGPGRYRFGGLRDFILGVRYVDGAGEVVRGGGQVVKNAAGFDIPKLMVGSLGRYGALAELTFKVFPRPAQTVTLRVPWPTLARAAAAMQRVYAAPLDVDALDLWPAPEGGWALLIRLAGPPAALPLRVERLRPVAEGDAQLLEGDADLATWRAMREMEWVPPGWGLVKVPLTPAQVAPLDGALSAGVTPRQGASTRFSVGGNVAWIAAPDPHALDPALRALGLSGLVVFGPPGSPLIGAPTGASFERRVKAALDPTGKFTA